MMIRLHFDQLTIKGEFHDRGLPVLLIGNHFGWWDGFIANLLNMRIFHRRFHVMMLEEQLQSRMFLNKAGAYSICPGKRSVLESLAYTANLLNVPENLVVLYPQGEFQSIHDLPVRFQTGINKVLSRQKAPLHLVFYVALTDYFSRRKPSLTIYFREFDTESEGRVKTLEEAYNEFHDIARKQQKPE